VADDPGIYVGILIRAGADETWRCTKVPDLHQLWDLRFSAIDYLPKSAWRAHHGWTRAQPHHLEIRSADHPGANLARLSQADHREADRREVAERAQRFHA
jgi:hypothetical protein